MKRVLICLLLAFLISGVGLAQNTTEAEQARRLFELGEQLYAEGRYAEALLYYQDALKLHRELDDRQAEGVALNQMGRAYQELQEYSLALEAFQGALEIDQEIERWIGVGVVQNNIGALYGDWGDKEKALEYYNRALDTYNNTHIHYPEGKGRTLANIAWLHNQSGAFEAALEYYLLSYPVSQSAGDYSEQLSTAHQLGDLFARLDEDALALEYFNQSLAMSRKIGNHATEGTTLNDIGVICDNHHQADLAADYYLQGLNQHRLTRRPWEEVITLGNLARLSSNQGNYTEALQYWQQQLVIYRQNGRQDEEITTLREIGWTFRELRDYDAAINALEQALQLAQTAHDTLEIGAVYANFGHVYYDRENYDSALSYYSRSLAIYQSVEFTLGIGLRYADIGKIHRAMDDYDESLDDYRQALMIFRELDHKYQIGLTLNALAEVHELRGEFSVAEEYRSQILSAEEPSPICQAPPEILDPMPSSNPTQLVIVNDSDTPICHVYLAELDRTDAGQDWLGSREYVPSHTSVEITVPAGHYDLSLSDCSGNPMHFQNDVNLTHANTVTYRFNPDIVKDFGAAVVENMNVRKSREVIITGRAALAVVIQTYRIADTAEFQATIYSTIGWSYFDIGQYAAGEAYALRSIDMFSELGQISPDAIDALMIAHATLGNIYTTQGRFDDALSHYDSAHAITISQRDDPGMAIFSTLKAMIHRLRGNNLVAISLLQDTLNTVANENDGDFARSMLCEVWRIQGNYGNESCEVFLQAKLELDPELQALNSLILGATKLESGDYASALSAFDAALEIYAASNNTPARAEVLNGKSMALFYLGRYQEALDTLDEALVTVEQNNMLVLEEQIVGNKASVLYNMGQIGESLGLFFEALDLSRELGIRSDEAAILANLGNVNQSLGRYQQAENNYSTALSIATELDEVGRQAIILNNLGTLYAQYGEYETSLEMYMQALEIQRASHDRDGVGYTQTHIGEILRLQKRYSEALLHLEDALIIHEEVGNVPAQAAVLNLQARVHAGVGDYKSAFDEFAQAIDLAENVHHPSLEYTFRTDRGAIYELVGDTDKAIADYTLAAELYVQLLHGAAIDDAALGLMNKREREESFPYNESPLQRLAVLYVQKGEIEQAFDYVERDKSLLLRSDLTNGYINYREDLSSEQLEQEIQLRWQLEAAHNNFNRLYQNLAEGHNQDIQNAYNMIKELQDRYTILLENMQLRGGYLEREIATDTRSLSEIQSVIPSHATLVVYSLGYGDSLAFVVTSNSIDAVILDVSIDSIDQDVEDFTASRESSDIILSELYGHLIAPITPLLTSSQIIIVPDGALHNISFASLHNRDGRYLIEDYSVQYVSSATSYFLLHERSQSLSHNEETPFNAVVLAQPIAANLPILENAISEAEAISEILNTTPFLNATEADLRHNIVEADVIYITAHAEVDNFRPLFSTIYLGAAENEGYDGNIHPYEVFELSIQNTDIVILSGCETGITEDDNTEGIGLFIRSWIIAGSNKVVSSLWVVDEESTILLLTSFMRNRVDMNDAEALRLAMIHVKQKYPDPFYWAGFSLNGIE